MILLTRLNGVEFTLNDDMIEIMSENPDTTIQLNNGKLYIVKESMREVIAKTIAYRRQIAGTLPKTQDKLDESDQYL